MRAALGVDKIHFKALFCAQSQAHTAASHPTAASPPRVPVSAYTGAMAGTEQAHAFVGEIAQCATSSTATSLARLQDLLTHIVGTLCLKNAALHGSSCVLLSLKHNVRVEYIRCNEWLMLLSFWAGVALNGSPPATAAPAIINALLSDVTGEKVV